MDANRPRIFARGQKVLAAAVTTFALLALAGCGASTGSSSTPSSTSSAGAPTGAAQQQASKVPALPAGLVPVSQSYGFTQPKTLNGDFPVKTKPPTGKHICFVENGNQYSELFQQGAAAASKALGWDMTIVQANQSEASSYASAISSAEQAGCQAVIEVSALYANYQSAIPSARAHHMIILDANTANKVGPGVIQALDTNQSSYYSGEADANIVLRKIKSAHPTGNVSIMDADVPEFQSIFTPLLAGFKRQIAAGCGSRCSVYTITDDLSAITGSNPAAPFTAALQSHPGTDYISQSGFMVTDLASAVKQAGLPVPGIAVDGGLPAQVADLQSSDPSLLGINNQPFVTQGWFMIDALVRYFEHMPVNPWTKVAQIRWIGTPQNVSKFKTLLNTYPVGYQQMFEKMWKVS
jgi:Periplasmic binding protein domain